MKCHPDGYHWASCFDALRAEVATLREGLKRADRWTEDARRELADARALLARVLDWEHGNHKNPDADYWAPDVYAFLARRDEGQGWTSDVLECVVCGKQGGCDTHGSTRDEARRCRVCGPEPWAQNHAEHADAARDEARRLGPGPRKKGDVCEAHRVVMLGDGDSCGVCEREARAEARQVARWNPSARQCSGEGCTTFGHGEKCPARDDPP